MPSTSETPSGSNVGALGEHDGTAPRADGDRLDEHERERRGSGFRSRQEPLREHGQQQRRRGLRAQGQRETRPHEPNSAATATHPTNHWVSSSASVLDPMASGPVSTSEHREMRIPIATGTPSGAVPRATAARSLAHKESTRRGALEPSDGATVTGPMEHSVSTEVPDPDATESCR